MPIWPGKAHHYWQSRYFLSPAQARDQAKEILGHVIKGIDPEANNKTSTSDITFAKYIEKHHQPWAVTHRKSGEATITRIKLHFFKILGNKNLSTIHPLLIEQWRIKR